MVLYLDLNYSKHMTKRDKDKKYLDNFLMP